MQPKRRLLKVAEAIREVVGMSILAEVKDPRVQDVTVTHVEVSPDLRYAKVHVSVMGDEAKQQQVLQGLRSAAGFLQARCAARIETRYTPRLRFVLDQGVKRSIAVAEILRRVLPPAQEPEAVEQTDEVIEDVETGSEVQPTETPACPVEPVDEIDHFPPSQQETGSRPLIEDVDEQP